MLNYLKSFVESIIKKIVVVIASETLHRPELARFRTPHGIQGEVKQSQ